jgi:1-aminocyclopropane-1-carboxylate synthase
MNHLLAFSIGDPGDGVLTGRPVYGRFEFDFGSFADLDVHYADMKGVDPFGDDVATRYEIALEEAIHNGVNIRALLIVNPNNPTGRPAILSHIRMPC